MELKFQWMADIPPADACCTGMRFAKSLIHRKSIVSVTGRKP